MYVITTYEIKKCFCLVELFMNYTVQHQKAIRKYLILTDGTRLFISM